MENPVRQRVLVAVLAGCYGIAWVLWDHARAPLAGADFDQVWYAARALRSGLNPYNVIGPTGSWYQMPWPLYYPMPAILVAWPFSFLPVVVARCVFTGVSSALLAFGLTRRAWFPLILFASGAYIEAARVSQWSPLFAAACLLPALAVVFPVKPTVALICAPMVKPSRELAVRIVGAWLLLVGLSFAVQPGWIRSWLAAIAQAPHIQPLVTAQGGWLLLLALVRWRRPEAWLLVAYAVVPHTRVPYEAVPVLLVASTRIEWLTLALGSALAYAAQALVPWFAGMDRDARIALLVLVAVYLPALAMVLRRPNVAAH